MTTARAIRLPLAAAAVALVVGSGCTDEQRRSLGEADVEASLAGHVEAVIASQGLQLDGDLDCSSNIAADGAVTGSCTGTTTDGLTATGTFTGTGDVDAETCSARLVIDVDAEVAEDAADIDCFATE